MSAARRVPRALTIAGSDGTGGAGLQADLKTFAARGVHGLSVVAALTAQTTRGVRAVHPVPPAFVRAQIEAVFEDIGADAVKTGMLLGGRTVAVTAQVLGARRVRHLVVDPVMRAKGGETLLAPSAYTTLRDRLLPLAEVVTPNRAEATALTGVQTTDRAGMEAAASAIGRLGPRAVLITGGDLAGGADDLLLIGRTLRWLHAPRVHIIPPHGTGCTLSAAIAAELAKGASIERAVVSAKRYTLACIRRARRLGRGYPVLGHLA